MKGDFTRSTFKPANHYSSVRMQQGRVELDADWNEQADITAHRVETEALDTIGTCGGPLDGAGFALRPQGNDLQIGRGRYYVDGILCENESAVLATQQLDLPPRGAIVIGNSTVALPAPTGIYIAYLDVWSRHITALDDPLVREVALGGPDSGTRSKAIWQVKFLRVGNVGDRINCLTPLSSWGSLIAAPTGQLAARTSPADPDPNPCIVAPGAGYRRLENQLYRVEIHRSGATGAATFKWSRDNGSIVTLWLQKTNNELTVSSIGRDKVLNFASGQWIELSDDSRELRGQPGTLVRLVKAEGNVLTIDPATATGTVNLSDFAAPRKVRRWDSPGEMAVTVPDSIALEDGVEITFKAATTYRSGDYWLIPARTATADVEWPKDSSNVSLSLPPQGIDHHYCRLAVVEFNGAAWSVTSDCRCLFPSLNQVNSLYYVSGDGQEAMPDLTQPAQPVPLPQPLVVGVVNSQCRDQRPRVRFKVVTGVGKVRPLGGSTAGAVFDIPTDDGGLATCEWFLDTANWSQQVEATLLDAGNNPIQLPIRFNANLSIADKVAYDPGQCGELNGKKTVQQALEQLSSLVSLFPFDGNNQSGQAGNPLARPLTVIAASKCGPVAGMNVQFTVKSGGGSVTPATPVATSGLGLSSCQWTPGSLPEAQIVEAEIISNPNLIVPPIKVEFAAQLVSVRQDPGFHITALRLLTLPPKLRNNMELEYFRLENGIQIDCDDEPALEAVANRPVVFLTIERPVPMNVLTGVAPIQVVGAFQPLVLPGDATAAGNSIKWVPGVHTISFLSQMFKDLRERSLPGRVLARFTAKGNFIWAKRDPLLYLDGEAFGMPPIKQFGFPNDLRVGGDGRIGGDFEMWFWLTPSLLKVSGVQVFSNQFPGQVLFTMTNPTQQVVVPFIKVPNVIEIQFTNPVDTKTVIDSSSFAVQKTGVPVTPIRGNIASGTGPNTIRWTSIQALGPGSYEVLLRGSGTLPITSLEGSLLDGEPAASLPSGDDKEGGDFKFTLVVAP